jgi:sec-independent protein translocase protein TatB
MRWWNVFSNLDGWKLGVLLLLAIFLFGPERLPKFVGDALRIVRQARRIAREAVDTASREVGLELSLEDLHPKSFIRKHLLGDDDQARFLAPLREAVDEAWQVAADARSTAESAVARAPAPQAAERTFLDLDAT